MIALQISSFQVILSSAESWYLLMRNSKRGRESMNFSNHLESISKRLGGVDRSVGEAGGG